ncbi:ornithine cyclodeaminase family protein [uncultured Roseobacter sp.]|uniref:ornithine cyclodeaminase family protein n=1 Tax=uncultured Roseobacter sp. TaxID=114847 RepID=UPI0026297C77|nr:ornithine cyclodeaminase family protein [uncultured Roseobacter sp.]
MISLTRSEIEALIDLPAAADAIEAAYRAASSGDVNLPPVGHITFPDRDADCHIKYGHVKGDRTFVIKVATGFPQNDQRGLPGGNGIVLVMSAETGTVQAILHDEMVLTDIRTGLGGAVASRTLARTDSKRVLVVGTGPQARRQIEAHAVLMPQLSFAVWGRDSGKAAQLVVEMSDNFDVTSAPDLQIAARQADIIVTATGSTTPLLVSDWVQPGTHITAVGADAPGKQELDVALIARADVLAVDLASQCLDHGEVSHAAQSGLIRPGDLTEIGTLLQGSGLGRTDERQITVADLTGIAAQDIAMANAVLHAWRMQNL